MTNRQKNLLIKFSCAGRALLFSVFYLCITLVICLAYGQRDFWYMELPVSTLLLYSLSRAAGFGDRILRKQLDGVALHTHTGTLAFLAKDSGSRIELIVLLLTVFLVPVDFGICSIGGLFFRNIQPYLLRRLVMLALALPFLLLSWYFGRRAAIIRLAVMPRYERESPRGFLPQILSYIGIGVLYVVGAYTFLLTLGGVFITLRFALMAPLLTLILIGVWMLLYGMQYVRVFRARYRLYHRLCRIARRNGYTVTRRRGLYRSVLFPQTSPHFSVKVGEQIYDCRVCSSIHKAQNFFFDADGVLTSSPAGPRRGLLGLFAPPFSVRTPYAFTSENRKVLIVTPAVWRWYISEGTSHEVDIGSWVFDYKLYNAGSFLGILERGAIDEDFKRK